jgi:hypothetical protein
MRSNSQHTKRNNPLTQHTIHALNCYLLSRICKRKFYITCICCSACNHHLQRIHLHCHWETCGFGIHMGPHSQCRALLVWIQHVTLREQKQSSKLSHNRKENGHPLLSPHTRVWMLFSHAYIWKLLDRNCSTPLLMGGSSNNAKTLTIKHYVHKTNFS